MADAVLIFTFGPIQPFIMDARRASDLFAGSRILVHLAKAAAEVAQRSGELVFPATLSDDVPNKLVAVVPEEQARDIAESMREALLRRWDEIAMSARSALLSSGVQADSVFNEIWWRQTGRLWEVYWAAAPARDGYAQAYSRADAALSAAKRTRAFDAAEEYGIKDSLSGQREALHTAGVDARKYWADVANAQGMTAARLRPDGRERLDAIASVKRFCELDGRQAFASTSTVASEDFLQEARKHRAALSAYRRAVEALIPGDSLYRVRPDAEWPYDGDLLYLETLAKGRLFDSYGLAQVDEGSQKAALNALRQLYAQVEQRPSPYYAVIVLDGDRIGARIAERLEAEDPGQEHQDLSQRLSRFAGGVAGLVGGYHGSLVYNGGDDVLLMAPLSQAVPVAAAIAADFRRQTGGTASAGIAVSHHLHPLDSALRAAREAEQAAKQDYGRDAVCVHALKRSGETLRVGSKWSAGELDTGELFNRLVRHFQAGELSSRFAYDLAEQALSVAGLEAEAEDAVIKRAVRRHKTEAMTGAAGDELTGLLSSWTRALEVRAAGGESAGLAELGRWLVLARFVGTGGDE